MKIIPSFITSLKRGDNGAYAWGTSVVADYPHPGGKIGYCQAPSAIESMQKAVVWFQTNQAALELKHAPKGKAEPVLPPETGYGHPASETPVPAPQVGLPAAEPNQAPAKLAVRPWGNAWPAVQPWGKT